MYYRAEGNAVCADVIPYYENGRFYLFYLKDFRDAAAHGEGCPWCLLTTEDLVHYEEHGEVICRGTAEEQDLYVFTGSCIRRGDEYFIFYTGHNPHMRERGLPVQKILRAKSRDLLHWEKDKEFVLEAPEWLELHDFRDPYVYFDEEKQKYGMLLAVRSKCDGPAASKGATLALYSDDLYHWSPDRKLFYAPAAFYTHECPDLFYMGGWWYLIFSEFTDKSVTTYRMARSIGGPWITPKVNTFDGHAFYAAKTASDGKRRFLFGWNCLKRNEDDDQPWIWGGTIIPHELAQDGDGTLYVKCPKEIQSAYHVPVPEEDGSEMNLVERLGGGWRVGGNGGKGIKAAGRMPLNCKIEMDVTVYDDIGDFGLLLRADENLDQYYAVRFEPKMNRLALDKVPRKDDKVHVQVDVERYCPMEPGVTHKLLLIVEGSVLECYVDDRVAMSARMFNRPEGSLALYAQHMTADFRNISIMTV